MQAVSELSEVSDDTRAGAEAVYAEHRDRVFHWALRYGAGDAGWAEDLLHDVFVKLLEQLNDEAPQDVGGWLYRVTANLAISRIRRERSLLGRLHRALVPHDAGRPPDELLEERAAATEALRLLSKLPERERVVLCMKVLDGRTQRQISEALGLSEGYVSKLAARAWQRVRAAGWEGADEP